MKNSLDLAVLGNCEIAALVDADATIVWCCLPRFDGDPLFHALVAGSRAEEGSFAIDVADKLSTRRRYLTNTAILETDIASATGIVRITDHVPRYQHWGRILRPSMIVRRIEPISGQPQITIRMRPLTDWGRRRPDRTRGSNHVRYLLEDQVVRLTTTVPAEFIDREITFVLDRPHVLVLGPDEAIVEELMEFERRSRECTHDYWTTWTRGLALPFEWQDVVVRSAITLKLCAYEQSGGIVAALTTSVPEYGSPGRNWDYRFCWLRDAFFSVQALNRLGATAVMENFMGWVKNVVARSPSGYLQPLYGLTFESRLEEREVKELPGYRDLGPVRVGNGAYSQVQNDSYGSVVLALAQSFWDTRLTHRGDHHLFAMLEPLGEQAMRRWNEPDAGVWEYRGRQSVHTHSAVMCWAACDRLARIADHLGLADRAAKWRASADFIHGGIVNEAWNEELNSFTSCFGGKDVDASLLLLADLGFVAPRDPMALGTLAEVERRLRHGNHLYRYAGEDDFGEPESAFNICTLWLAETLARVGREEEAREVFASVLAVRNDVGLLSEGVELETGELWGNFPQTYSMVGLIRCARRLSKSWEDAF